MDSADVRSWAAGCASRLRDWAGQYSEAMASQLPEAVAWDTIAERGFEWKLARNKNGKPYRGGAMMTRKHCFNNAARTVFGFTNFDPEGCQYAEGFACGFSGLWFHHAWVISSAGLVIERTWEIPGSRYIGVVFSQPFPRPAGRCQLSDWPLGISFAPQTAGKELYAQG